jgi:hypothetical protein
MYVSLHDREMIVADIPTIPWFDFAGVYWPPSQSPVPMDHPCETVEEGYYTVETIATGLMTEETTTKEARTEKLQTITVPPARPMEAKARLETPQPVLQPDHINPDKEPAGGAVSFREIRSSAPLTPKLKTKTTKLKKKVIPTKSKESSAAAEEKSGIPSTSEGQDLDNYYSKQESVLDNLNVSSLVPDVTGCDTPPPLLLREVIDDAVKLLEKEQVEILSGQTRSVGQAMTFQEINNYSLSSRSQFLSRHVSEERKLSDTTADDLKCKTHSYKNWADPSQHHQAATNDVQNFNTQRRTAVNNSQSVAEKANDDVKLETVVKDAAGVNDDNVENKEGVALIKNPPISSLSHAPIYRLPDFTLPSQPTPTSIGSSPRFVNGKPPMQRSKSDNLVKVDQLLRERKEKTPKPGEEHDQGKTIPKQLHDQDALLKQDIKKKEPAIASYKEEYTPEKAREPKKKGSKPDSEPDQEPLKQEVPIHPMDKELQENKKGSSKVTSHPPVAVPANRVPNGLKLHQENTTTSPSRDVRSPTPTQSTTIKTRFRNLVNPTRISDRAPSNPPMVFSKESSIPRRAPIFDQYQSRASSTMRSPAESRATSPTLMQHTTPSKFDELHQTRTYYSPARSATVVSTSYMQRSKSIHHLNDDIEPPQKSRPWISSSYNKSNRATSMNRDCWISPMNRDWTQTYDSKAFTSSAQTRNTPVRDEPINTGPRVIERPSRLIKSVTPSPREDRPPRPQHQTNFDYNTSRVDRIPSRYKKAMNHSNTSSMTRSRSVHQLNEETKKPSTSHLLQDQINKAKNDHKRVFDDAKCHTSFQREQNYNRSKLFTDTARSGQTSSTTTTTRPRESNGDWLTRTSSARNLRVSPTMEYRRL